MAKVIDITPRLKTVNTTNTHEMGNSDPKLLNMQEHKGKFQPRP